MKIANLEELLVHEIQDLHSAETQLLKALTDMAEAASSDELREAFEDHRRETVQHVRRLEQVAETLGVAPNSHKCKGIAGIIAEGSEFVKGNGVDDRVRDAALIAAAQRAEHYEIAGYGTVAAYCELLGRTELKDILGETLEEEREADDRLTEIAMQISNPEAISDEARDADDDMDDMDEED